MDGHVDASRHVEARLAADQEDVLPSRDNAYKIEVEERFFKFLNSFLVRYDGFKTLFYVGPLCAYKTLNFRVL